MRILTLLGVVVRTILFAVTGLFVAYQVTVLLHRLGMIKIDFLTFTRGGPLFFLVMLCGLTVGLLLSARKWTAALIATGVMLVISLAAVAVGLSERRAVQAAIKLQAEARQAALAAYGPQAADATAYPPVENCREVLVWVGDGSEDVWYWYSQPAKRILGSLTEERARQLIIPLLPTNARVVDIRARTHVGFVYTLGGQTKHGELTFNPRCRFELYSLRLEDQADRPTHFQPIAP